MKLVFKLITCLLITVILFLNSCKKEYSCENCIGNNKPPIAHAGKDTTIILPVDSVTLDVRASTDDSGGKHLLLHFHLFYSSRMPY